jgi:hypothetical protein
LSSPPAGSVDGRPRLRQGVVIDFVGDPVTNSLAVELGEFGIRVNSVHTYGTDHGQ